MRDEGPSLRILLCQVIVVIYDDRETKNAAKKSSITSVWDR